MKIQSHPEAKVDRARFKVAGQSMLPLLKNNDWVMIDFRERKTQDIGDIVLIKKQDGLLLHRIIGKSKNCFFSKGDNQKYTDASISSNEIIGTMISIDKRSKFFDWFFPVSNFVLIIIGRIYFAFFLIYRRLTGKEII